MDDHAAIQALFERFAAAVQAGDVEALRALWVADAPVDEETFEANSEKVRAAGWALRLGSIEQEGDVAELGFAVVDGDEVVDEAELTVTREGAGWRLRGL